MIDIESEKLIRLADVPKLKWLPARRGGATLAVQTVRRWITAGRKGVKLEAIVAGGLLCTTEAAVLRFFERLTSPNTDAKAPTPSENAKAQKRAEAILKRFGI